MKKLIFLLLVAGFSANGQSYQTLIDEHECELPIDSTSGLIYQEIITEVPGISKKELYTRFKIWSANAFKSLPDVLKLDDPENSTVILKGHFDFTYQIRIGLMIEPTYATWHGYFTLTSNFKDGKYRVIMNNFGILSSNNTDLGNPVLQFHPWESEHFEKSISKKSYVNSGITTEQRFIEELEKIKKSLVAGMEIQNNSKSDW